MDHSVILLTYQNNTNTDTGRLRKGECNEGRKEKMPKFHLRLILFMGSIVVFTSGGGRGSSSLSTWLYSQYNGFEERRPHQRLAVGAPATNRYNSIRLSLLL